MIVVNATEIANDMMMTTRGIVVTASTLITSLVFQNACAYTLHHVKSLCSNNFESVHEGRSPCLHTLILTPPPCSRAICCIVVSTLVNNVIAWITTHLPIPEGFGKLSWLTNIRQFTRKVCICKHASYICREIPFFRPADSPIPILK